MNTRNTPDSKRKKRKQSLGEEIANSISHGFGLIAVIVGIPFLIVHAARNSDAGFIVGASIFSASMVLLYLASTLYHAFPPGKYKRRFRVIEHSMIYVLIAGTYTPITFGVLRGALGWTIFGIVWGLAMIGVILKIFCMSAHYIVNTGLYLLMGWLVVIAIEPLFARMTTAGLVWLIAGGIAYTIGVAFYATDSKLRYGHFIWHLFVITGTVCHYFVVLWYSI